MRKAEHFATLCKIIVSTSMPQASARRTRLLLTPRYEEKDHIASKPWAIVLESKAVPRESLRPLSEDGCMSAGMHTARGTSCPTSLSSRGSPAQDGCLEDSPESRAQQPGDARRNALSSTKRTYCRTPDAPALRNPFNAMQAQFQWPDFLSSLDRTRDTA